MCTNQKLIFPRYSKRSMYVKCGHCPACLQEKAAKRVKRINDTYSDELVCTMVALTYSRGCAPYVLRSDAYDFVNGRLDSLNIYRDCSIRKVRKPIDRSDYHQVYKRNNVTVLLDSIDFVSNSSLSHTKDLKHEHGKIGVVYYKDMQHFVARLRLNLKRHYNYEGKIFIYACSEFGVRSQRPHFHLLIFCPKSVETSLRSAIFESWPFSNLARFPRAVERCYKGASYVASYVNQSSDFPLFYRDYFKPKHSYSKGFGVCNPKYSLSEILSKYERGNLKLSVAKTVKGLPSIVDIPFPKYVINRYFPKFKGYTRCPPSSLLSYLERIYDGSWQTEVFPYEPLGFSFGLLYLTADECRTISVMLHNAYKRFIADAPDGYSLLPIDYLRLHINIWNLYNSSVLRLHMENVDIPFLEKFDNLDELNNNTRLRCVLGFGIDTHFDVTCPNDFQSVKYNTYRFEESFKSNIKHRNVANSIYLLNEDCEL